MSILVIILDEMLLSFQGIMIANESVFVASGGRGPFCDFR